MDTESNKPITAGLRQSSVSNEDWNQQTLVDVRSLFHTQFSNDSSQQLQQENVRKSKRIFSINSISRVHFS